MKRFGILTCLLILSFTGSAWAEERQKLTLEQAIATALQNYPVVQETVKEIEAVRANRELTNTLYYPEIHLLGEDLAGTNSSTRSSYLSLLGIPRTGNPNGSFYDVSNNFLGGLVVNQNLYDFGRRSGLLKASEARVHAEEANLLTIQKETVLNVKQAYFALLAAKRIILANQANVDRTGKILDMVQKGYEVGLKPKIDVSTAKTKLSEAQLGLIRANNDMKNARTLLANAMGLDVFPDVDIEDVLNPEEVVGTLEDFVKKAYQKRPELKDALEREKIAEQQLEVARSNNYPYLTGSASVNGRGAEAPLTPNWDVAAILDVPIDWFRVRHQIDETQARYSKSKEEFRTIHQKVTLEVEEAYNDLAAEKESIPTAQQNLDQAKERLDIADGRYKVGVGNIIELTDAQTFLTNADVEFVRTLYSYHTAVARLERAIGGALK